MWLPMSPTQFEMPARLGSVRQAACFWPGLLEGRGQPVLGILGGDEADLPQLARGDHVPHVVDDGIAAIGVGDAEQKVLFGGQAAKLVGVAAGRRQGLVADDVKAVLEGELGDRDNG